MSVNRRIKSYWLVLFITLMIAGTASARELIQGDLCNIEADQIIDGTLFVLCEELNIDGQVRGDVIGAALRVTIRGHVRGSVYQLAGQMDVSGRVDGDFHFAGPVLYFTHPDLENPVEHMPIGGGVKFASFSTSVGQAVTLTHGVTGIGYQLITIGQIRGEVNFWGSAFIVNGLITGDVYASVGDPVSDSSQFESLLRVLSIDLQLSNPGLFISNGATIAGRLEYEGPAEGQIRGQTLYAPVYYPTLDPIPTLESPGSFSVYFDQFRREATTLFTIGLLALLIMPRSLNLPINVIRWRPFSSFSAGMLAFILSFPFILIFTGLALLLLFLLLVLGLDGVAGASAVFLGLVNFGGATFFYFVAIFFARAIIALAIGRLVYRIVMRRSARGRALYVALAAGAIVLGLLASLPVVGWLVNGVALFLGLGALLTLLLDRFSAIRGVTQSSPTWYPLSSNAPNRTMARDMPFFSPPADPTPRPSAHDEADEERSTRPRITIEPINAPTSDYQPPSQPDEPPKSAPPPRVLGLDNLPEGFDPEFFFNDDDDDKQ